jgi:acyl carrier protein
MDPVTRPLTRAEILQDLLEILSQIRDDWNHSLQVTEETAIFRDLGYESIDAVALGTAVEEHYGRSLPFAEFLTRVKAQQLPDIRVGLLVDFLYENLTIAQ